MTDTITIPRATVQQGLEALAIADNIALVGAAYTPKSIDRGLRKIRESATALRKALEQPEQEPVAYDKTEINCFVQSLYDEKMQEGKHGHYETMFYVVHQAIKKVAPPKQQAEPVRMPCIGKNPRCPCQDGDACHYKDCGNTKAWPVAQPEQEPSQWRDVVVVTLVREGINKHRARELADHFATPPAAQPEPALEPKHMVQSNGRHSSLLTHMMNKRTAPPQRPWLSLTGAEIDANEILRYHFSLNNGPVTRAGIAVVDTVTALLKAKNHG